MKLTISLSFAIALLLSLTVKTSVAIDHKNRDPLIIAEAQIETITEDEAAVIASKATGGKVISSETRGVAGVTVYRFRVLMSDGQVKIIQVKASSGEIL
jgi:uncharacterized membrane protein YkoI